MMVGTGDNNKDNRQAKETTTRMVGAGDGDEEDGREAANKADDGDEEE